MWSPFSQNGWIIAVWLALNPHPPATTVKAAERKLDLAGTIKPDVLFWPMKEDNTSSITLLYDGNTGRDLDSGVPLPYACPATTASNVSSSWIRLDLRGLFAVSRVRVITRASFANNSQVHVGNSLVENGLSNYQCGSLWVIAPNSNSFRGFPYDFKCQAAQWARYIVVVRNDPGEQLSVCELSVYVMESVASAPDHSQAHLHLHHLESLGTTVTSSPAVSGTYSRHSIDGTVTTSSCFQSNSTAPWLRLKLPHAYGVSSVRAILSITPVDEGIVVRVGESATEGKLNTQCGQILKQQTTTWVSFSCERPVTGRYIYVQSSRRPALLAVCEVEVFYELKVEVQHVGLIATSREVSVSRVWSLPLSLECGTDPGLSSLNEVLHARWSSPDLTVVGNSSQNGVWQQFTETQKLWISHISNNTQQGFFTCNYTVNSVNHIAGFTLDTTGSKGSTGSTFTLRDLVLALGIPTILLLGAVIVIGILVIQLKRKQPKPKGPQEKSCNASQTTELDQDGDRRAFPLDSELSNIDHSNIALDDPGYITKAPARPMSSLPSESKYVPMDYVPRGSDDDIAVYAETYEVVPLSVREDRSNPDFEAAAHYYNTI